MRPTRTIVIVSLRSLVFGKLGSLGAPGLRYIAQPSLNLQYCHGSQVLAALHSATQRLVGRAKLWYIRGGWHQMSMQTA